MVRFSPHFWSLLLLLLTTLIWGTTFPLSKEILVSLSPAVLVGIRFVVAAIAFLPFCRMFNLRLLRDGSLLGLMIFLANLTLLVGLESVTANRAAFITSLNVVLVPLLAWLLGRGVTLKVFAAAGLAFAGIAIMSWEAGTVGWGEIWVFGCALTFAIYILLIEAVAPNHPPLQLTAIQLTTVALFSLVWATPEGIEQLPAIKSHWLVLLYLGLATVFTTWSQVIAQRHLSATEAAIIYTLEPVFAAVFSFWWLSENLSGRGALGAALILAAMLLSQLVGRQKRQ